MGKKKDKKFQLVLAFSRACLLHFGCMKDLLLDLKDTVIYDLLKRPLPESPAFALEHNFILHKEDGGFWAESEKYPGLFASGETLEELREALMDSILTYFDVPRAVAKRLPHAFGKYC